MAGRFPMDHPIEALRGFKRPTLDRAKRVLAKRAAYLQRKIQLIALARGDLIRQPQLDER